MRSKRRLIGTLTLALAAMALVAAAALAAITGTSGAVQQIQPPSSVTEGALQSDSRIVAFDEQQCVRLASSVNVDVRPGGGAGTIPAGTEVSSQFLHFDPVTSNGSTISASGSITVDGAIIGAATSQANLDASDSLGAGGTTYPAGNIARGLDPVQGDSVSISGNQLTLSVSVNEVFHLDQVRVISHCVKPPPPPPPGDEGCTPGYWKQSQHFDSWVGYTQNQSYNAVFGVADSRNPTLLQALQAGGGGNKALGRHAVAALLNASSPGVDYPLTEAQVKAKVQEAYATGNFEQIKNELERFNELGCPLS